MKYLLLALSLAWMPAAPAADLQTPAPRVQDFAWGIPLDTQQGRPLLELALPESVYAASTRADLGDLRVFNAEGQVVPHALCLTPRAVPPRVEESPLPLFPLREGAAARDALGTQVRVETPAGTRVEVVEPGDTATATPPPPPPVRAWIADARGLAVPIQALKLQWHSTSGASEAAVRVLASSDLEHWSTLKDSSVLLRAEDGGQSLDRSRIPLPEGARSYLRLEPINGASGFVLDGLTAEQIVREERLPTRWIQLALAETPPKGAPEDLYFSSSYRAPVNTLRFELPETNMSLSVTLYSRVDDKAPWVQRWSGEVYFVTVGDNTWTTPAAALPATSDRQWRLHVQRGAETLAGRSPTLQLGYTPARLRFLSQGRGPFLLAYGSGRITTPSPACGSLLAGVATTDIESIVGQAEAGPAQTLAGSAALKKLKPPTPTRLIVLWGALIGGVLLLAGMALSLLKKVRQEN